MNINVHIERLVLDGLPVGTHQAAMIRAAVEEGLARTLGTGEKPRLSSVAVPFLNGGPIRLGADVSPRHLGQQIASAVCTSLGLQQNAKPPVRLRS